MSSGQDKRKIPPASDIDLPGSATENDPSPGGRKARAAGRVQSKDRDMGAALRSVYQETVDESVPDDLLDLLGKLD